MLCQGTHESVSSFLHPSVSWFNKFWLFFTILVQDYEGRESGTIRAGGVGVGKVQERGLCLFACGGNADVSAGRPQTMTAVSASSHPTVVSSIRFHICSFGWELGCQE